MSAGICGCHLGNNGVGDDSSEERFIDTQPLSEPDAPPQHPPQHIAAPFIAGRYAVHDQERAGASVLRHHPEGAIQSLASVPIPETPAMAAARRNDRFKEVRRVDVLGALDDRREPLKTHARVDVLLFQRRP